MRPELNLTTTPEQFTDFYWLKEELLIFCKENNIPASGSKNELTGRIYEYLKTGMVIILYQNRQKKSSIAEVPPALDSIIPEGCKYDEKLRTFFKAQIGEHFKFNVPFMNWMKDNAGKTYGDAISEWYKIEIEKKNGKRMEIASQFEYNQYTRDFFEANLQLKREDAVKCWKHKKSLPGHNRYEERDLVILNNK